MEFTWIGVSAVSVAALLAGHRLSDRRVVAVAKPVASVAFVALALTSGALLTWYGRLVLAALLLSLAGDIALLAPGTGRAFYAGMGSFALAHIVYTVAFASLGCDPIWLAAGVLGAAAVGAVSLAALLSKVTASTGRALSAYVAVISAMAIAATGAYGTGASLLVPLGAWSFLASDLFVARHRFVSAGFANKLAGLPLYYAAQLALAASVAYAHT